ncbi:hypothetical protein GCM10010294_69000 [Streptomyces griseoloalbus]|nr:hypothetical protein GCM10010294_69000 [Streptomyces griseoloalbus]
MVLERGTDEQAFGAPRQDRTRRFLRRIVEAGRLRGPVAARTATMDRAS